MLSTPYWLPPRCNTNGLWDDIVKRLYEIFQNDFVIHSCYYDFYKIIYDTRKIDSIYEEGFWHLISKEDYLLRKRIPDFPRAQKLPWCKPCIENINDQLIQKWDYSEANGRIRTYIWLKNFDYVVIIEKRRNAAFLVTAFHVSGESTRKRLNEKYIDREN